MLQREADRHVFARRDSVVPFFLMIVFLLLANVPQTAHAQTYRVIHNFTVNGGATPYGGPVFDRFGNMFGTTYTGGNYGSGGVYKLSHPDSQWAYTLLYSFKGVTDGAGAAFGTLAIGPKGTLFGTTEGGGYFGTTFAICPYANCARRESVVHSFGMGSDGAEPVGGVVFDSAGNFYGTTLLGGVYANGTVFQAAHSGKGWTTRVIYSFGAVSTDAVNPAAGVTVDAQGNLYGTTSFGGANGVGAVYKLSPSGSGWTESVLSNFQGLDDGQNPVGGLILDASGNLYGTTFDGGINGGGTVYELSPSGGSWTFTTLYSFTGGYGGPYNKLTFDSKGNLYGALNGESAYGYGSVFKLTPGASGWTYTDLYDFTNGTDGGLPYGSVAVDNAGNVFGTAVTGGSNNQGVVFEITP
jgi:uncharacterized repeat protein (TIGR03803 family)